MAGTVTVTESKTNMITQVQFDWLSDASGDVSGTSSTSGFNGQIVAVILVPDSGGTAPSDNYDVTITDGNSLDLLNGQGTDMSNVNTVVLVDNLLPVAGSKLALVVDNGGNAKGGNVYVRIKEY